MRTNFYSSLIPFAAFVVTQNLALATTPTPQLASWVQESQKTVYFASRPELAVSFSYIGADSDYWDQLNVSYSYDQNPNFNAELAALQAQYPGYTLVRAPIALANSASALTLSIPSLGKNDAAMTVKTSPNGPWFEMTYFVSKTQSAAVLQALQNDPAAVSVSGTLQTVVPQTKVVEHVALGADVCDHLVAGGLDLYSVMLNYSAVLQQINGMAFQYPSTKAALQRSVLDSCVDVASNSTVGSFKELLNIQTVEKSDRTSPFGETDQTQPTNISFPANYDVIMTLSGGPS